MTNPKTPLQSIPTGLDQDAAQPSAFEAVCDICGKPVHLDKCKTDEDGQAVHAACYFDRISGPDPAKG